MRNRYVLFLAFNLIFSQVYTQTLLYRSGLDTPHATGFYKIKISSELEARLRADLSDLRIVDGHEKEVPYVWAESSVVNRNLFQPFELLQNHTDTSGTTVVFRTKKESVGDVSLLIGNNAVERTASLSGSHDGRSWYIIHENLRLRNEGQNLEGRFIQTLHFPDSRYPFLKLVIHNQGTDPLNIVAAGQIEAAASQQEAFVQHAPAMFDRTEHLKSKTSFFIRNDLPYILEKIRLEIVAPRFYDRAVEVYLADSAGRKGRIIANGQLKSGAENSISLNGIKTQYLVAEVINNDDPPLEVVKISTAGRPRAIITWLEKEGNYHLVAGDPEAMKPSYDLARFRDSIPSQLPELTYSRPFGFVYSPHHGEEKKNTWLWPAIILMVVVLGFLTFKLLGEVKKREG